MMGCGSCALGAVSAPSCTDDAFEDELNTCVDRWTPESPGSELCARYMDDDAFAEQIDSLPFCNGETRPSWMIPAVVGAVGLAIVGFFVLRSRQ